MYYAKASENVVNVGTKTTSYYRMFNGKRYSFVGAYSSKSEAKQMAIARKMATGYNNRIVTFNGKYLLYTGK